MLRLLTVGAALLLGAIPATASETAIGGAPFCGTLAELRDYVPAIVNKDMPELERLQDCAWLKAGVRVEVTRTFMDFGGPRHPHPIGVRVYGNGTFADGFTVQELVR